jgi:opacity protein-like surface antigen
MTTVVLAIVYGLPTAGLAELFAGLYGGAAFPQASTVTTTVTRRLSGDLILAASDRVNFDSSFTVGGRVGYWFDPVPWFGVAFDISYFPARASARGSSVNIDVIPFSPLAMVRLPLLTSEVYPRGRMRPYAAVGPSFVFAHASENLGPAAPPVEDSSNKSVGLDVRAGLDWLFTPRLALFAEYRFFSTRVNTKDECGFICFGDDPITHITTTLRTHTVSAGLAYHF